MTEREKAGIITDNVCRYFNVNKRELKTTSRRREIVEPRQFVFYFCRKLTSLTTPALGAMFNKDHATILHGCRNVESLICFNGYEKKAKKMESSILVDFDLEDWMSRMGTMITDQ